MPAQHGLGADQEGPPRRTGKEPAESAEKQAVGGSEARPVDLGTRRSRSRDRTIEYRRLKIMGRDHDHRVGADVGLLGSEEIIGRRVTRTIRFLERHTPQRASRSSSPATRVPSRNQGGSGMTEFGPQATRFGAVGRL